MKYYHKIYIIIINYGTWKDTLECLNSIAENNYSNYKVIIVDVANLGGSLDHLSEWANANAKEKYHIMPLDDNKGFAAANNAGIQFALRQNDCEFIWLLNNDTSITKTSISELLECYGSHSRRNRKIAFVGSKLMDYQNRNRIQSVGGSFNPWSGYSIFLGEGEEDSGQYDEKCSNVDYILGAAMFFHKSVIDEIGLMPEEYFIYYEDIDWCISARKKGYSIIVCPRSTIYHKQGVSTGNIYAEKKYNPDTVKYLYCNYLKLYKKHYKALMPVAYFILMKQLLGKLYHRNIGEAKIIFKAILGL